MGAVGWDCGPPPPTPRDLARAIEGLGESDRAYEAALRLGSYGAAASDAVPRLVGALRREDSRVRTAVASALAQVGAVGAEQSVPALVTSLEDPDEDVRRAAINSLGMLGPAARAALPALERLRGDRRLYLSVRDAIKAIESPPDSE